VTVGVRWQAGRLPYIFVAEHGTYFEESSAVTDNRYRGTPLPDCQAIRNLDFSPSAQSFIWRTQDRDQISIIAPVNSKIGTICGQDLVGGVYFTQSRVGREATG